jgi:hypothetical protein
MEAQVAAISVTVSLVAAAYRAEALEASAVAATRMQESRCAD